VSCCMTSVGCMKIQVSKIAVRPKSCRYFQPAALRQSKFLVRLSQRAVDPVAVLAEAELTFRALGVFIN